MDEENIQLCDYVVAFIDLLGQKSEMPGRDLPSDKNEAIALVKKSVGRIVSTQEHFEEFSNGFHIADSIYSKFPKEIQSQIPDMAPGELKWQRFSDGFVIYVPLGEGLVKSPVNSIFGLLLASGLHCMIGLAGRAPVRIGIDVAWAVEYRPNEIYGAALAYSYKLESEVAQWPRVVIGEGLIDYLNYCKCSSDERLTIKFRAIMASQCLDLIEKDIDGHRILNYLGPAFKEASDGTFDDDVINKATSYIRSQINLWGQAKNKKLKSRYINLSKFYVRNGFNV